MRHSEKAKELCDRWNKLHPESSPVTVIKDNGEKLETVTRSEAWVLGGHRPVILVVGIGGGYSLARVSARKEAELKLMQEHRQTMAMVIAKQVIIRCAQLDIVSDGTIGGTVIKLDGFPRRDVSRIEFIADGPSNNVSIVLHLEPTEQPVLQLRAKKEAMNE